ncbi:unnamed protein product [Caenorhabditis brenneri]
MSEYYDLHELYKLGLDGKRQQSVKRRKGFELLWLPVLARIEVVRSMDIDEIMKLSMCSRRMEGMIRYTKVKSKKIEFQVNINNSILQIESFDEKVYHCSPDQLENGSIYFSLSRWIDRNSTSFRNCVAILKYLQSMISFKSLGLHVNFEGMTVEFIKEILTEPSLRDFKSLCLEKGVIDTKCLDLVMKTAQSNRSLHIKGTKIPRGYNHENAFKFHDIYCDDAVWVRIEHLFTLKDCYKVSLRRHKLSCSDVNTYIKFWVESDHDMVLTLSLKLALDFQSEGMFDGIFVLQGRRKGLIAYLVAANPTKQRKHQIMGVAWYHETLRLFSWDKNEPLRFGGEVYAESWAPEYKVLMALNKNKKLEGELERIQNSLEINQDQNVIEKKNEISRDLQNVSQELAGYNLVFRDGFYIYS